MKVKELIALLQTQDPEAHVFADVQEDQGKIAGIWKPYPDIDRSRYQDGIPQPDSKGDCITDLWPETKAEPFITLTT